MFIFSLFLETKTPPQQEIYEGKRYPEDGGLPRAPGRRGKPIGLADSRSWPPSAQQNVLKGSF